MPSDSQASRTIRLDQLKPDPDAPFPIDIPFIRMLGISLDEFSEGRATLGLKQEARHQNTFQMAHGGVVMTMLDVAMAMAGRSLQRDDDDPDKGMITIEMKTSFMRPGRGDIQARGHCVHRTGSMAFCEAELVNRAGDILARASGTFKYMKRR